MEQKRNKASQNFNGSIPPQVVGKECGKLLLRVKNLNLFDNSGSYGKKIKFEWWGEKNGPIVLQIPWKSGYSVAEATFQICAPQSALRDYFSDMGSLKLYLINSDMISIGRVIIPLDKLNESDFHFDHICPVKSLHGLVKKDIGTLLVEIRTRFYEVEQKIVQQSVVNEIPEVKDTKLILQDYPENPKHKLQFSKNSLQDSFQRNEALAFTDHSEKYSQWPTAADTITKQLQLKQSTHQRGLSEYSTTSIMKLEDVAIADDRITLNNLQGGKHASESHQNSQTIKPNTVAYTPPTATPRKKRARPFTAVNRVTFRPDIPSRNSKMSDASLVLSPISTATAPQDEYQHHPNSKLDTSQRTNSMSDSSLGESHHLDGLTESINTPTPNSMITPYNNPMDDILLKAETLLNRVQNSVKQSSHIANDDSIRPLENHPREYSIITGAVTDAPTSENSSSSAYVDRNNKDIRITYRDSLTAGGTGSGHVDSMHLMDSYTPPVFTEDSTTSKLNWLLMGVPEVFEEDPEEVNDELVDRLLREGGPPPSQMAFPSLHYASQIAMQKLANIRALRVTITRLHINSSKCGVRKVGSYILLQPPVGCVAQPLQSTERRINLNDALREPSKEGVNSRIVEYRAKNSVAAAAATAASHEKRTLQKEYAVGVIAMHRSETWIVRLDNSVISSWLSSQSSSSGTLRLELYSCLDPTTAQPSARRNAKQIEFMKFGYANFPLSGLLNTNNLDAMLTCILEADPTTSNIVRNKFEKLPYSRSTAGMGGGSAVSGSASLGSVTVRVTLLEDETEPATTSADRDYADAVPLGIPVPQMQGSAQDPSLPVIATGSRRPPSPPPSLKPPGSRSEGEVNLDRALAFLPLEARRLKAKSDISSADSNNENAIIFQTYQRRDSTSDRLDGTEEYKTAINSPQAQQQYTSNYQEDREFSSSPIVVALLIADIHIDLLTVKRLPLEVVDKILFAASTLQPTPMLSNECDFKLVVSYKVACGAGDSIRERIEITSFPVDRDSANHVTVSAAVNVRRRYSLPSRSAWKLSVLEVWAEYVFPATTAATSSTSDSPTWHRCLLGLATVNDSASRPSHHYQDRQYNNEQQEQPLHKVAIIDPIYGDAIGELSYGITADDDGDDLDQQSLETRHLPFSDGEMKVNREVVVDEDSYEDSHIPNSLSTNPNILGTPTKVNNEYSFPPAMTTSSLLRSPPPDTKDAPSGLAARRAVDVSASLSLSQISVDSLASLRNATASPPRWSYAGATSTATEYHNNSVLVPMESRETDSLKSHANINSSNGSNGRNQMEKNHNLEDENNFTNNVDGILNSDYPVTSEEFEVVLDMFIEDSFADATDGSAAAVTAVRDSLGCFVFYGFPCSAAESSQNTTMTVGAPLHTTSSNHHATNVAGSAGLGQHCLWWDSQCSMLNSRSRHIFQLRQLIVEEGRRGNSQRWERQEEIDVSGREDGSHHDKDITFRIVLSDEEGGAVAGAGTSAPFIRNTTTTGSTEQHQIAAGTVFATVLLKEKEWLPFVRSRPTGVKRLTLPLLPSTTHQQSYQPPTPTPMYLRLVIEHRRIPSLYNSSKNSRVGSLVAATVSGTNNIPNPIESFQDSRLLPPLPLPPATTPPTPPLPLPYPWNDTALESKPSTHAENDDARNESLVGESEAITISLEEIYNLKLVPDVDGSALIVSASVRCLDNLNSNNDLTSESLHSTMLQVIPLSSSIKSGDVHFQQLSPHGLFEWKNTPSDSSFSQVKISPLRLETGRMLSTVELGGKVNGSDNDRDAMRRLAVVVHLHLRPPWRMTASPPPPPPTAYDPFHSLHHLQQHPSNTTPTTTSSLSPSLLLGDHLVGHAVVPLSPLATGFPYIQGWYHIQDSLQRCQGQLKLSVTSAATSPPLHTIRTSIASLADFPYHTDGSSDRKENTPNYSPYSEGKSTGALNRFTANRHHQSERLDTNMLTSEMLPKANLDFEYVPSESKNSESTSRLQRLVASLEKVRQRLTGHHEVKDTSSERSPDTADRGNVVPWDRPLYEDVVEENEDDEKERDTSLDDNLTVSLDQIPGVISKDGIKGQRQGLGGHKGLPSSSSSRWQDNRTMRFIIEKEEMEEEKEKQRMSSLDKLYESGGEDEEEAHVGGEGEGEEVSCKANQNDNSRIYNPSDEVEEYEDDVNSNEVSGDLYYLPETAGNGNEEEEEDVLSYFLSKPMWSPSHGFSSLLDEEKEVDRQFENKNDEYCMEDIAADNTVSKQVVNDLLGNQFDKRSASRRLDNVEIDDDYTTPSDLATEGNVIRGNREGSQFNEQFLLADEIELVPEGIQTSGAPLAPAVSGTEESGSRSPRRHEGAAASLQPDASLPSGALSAALEGRKESSAMTAVEDESEVDGQTIVGAITPDDNDNNSSDYSEPSPKDPQQDRQTVSVSVDRSQKESVDSATQCDIGPLQASDVPPASISDSQGLYDLPVSTALSPDSNRYHEIHLQSSTMSTSHTNSSENPPTAMSDSDSSGSYDVTPSVSVSVSRTENPPVVALDTIYAGDQISDSIPNELFDDANIFPSVPASAVSTQDRIRQLVEEEVARVLQSPHPVVASSDSSSSSSSSSTSYIPAPHAGDIMPPPTTTAALPNIPSAATTAAASNSVKKPLPVPSVDDLLKTIRFDDINSSSIDRHILRDHRQYTNSTVTVDHSSLLTHQRDMYYQETSSRSRNSSSSSSLPYNSIGLQIIDTSGNKKASSFVPFPGRRKKFIDSETDRISKIMMSKLSQPGALLTQK